MLRHVAAALVAALCSTGAVRAQTGPVGLQAGPVAYLKASNPDEDDQLGSGDPLKGLTVALSRDGTTLAMAAPHEDSAATGINGEQSDNASSDFRTAIAMSGDGNTLAVCVFR